MIYVVKHPGGKLLSGRKFEVETYVDGVVADVTVPTWTDDYEMALKYVDEHTATLTMLWVNAMTADIEVMVQDGN